MDAFRLRSVNRVQRRRCCGVLRREKGGREKDRQRERERERKREKDRVREGEMENEGILTKSQWCHANGPVTASAPVLSASRTRRLCCARRGLTQFHTYFNTGKTVRKLRDMHKRLCKLGYKMGIARPVSRARPLHAKSFRAGVVTGNLFLPASEIDKFVFLIFFSIICNIEIKRSKRREIVYCTNNKNKKSSNNNLKFNKFLHSVVKQNRINKWHTFFYTIFTYNSIYK